MWILLLIIINILILNIWLRITGHVFRWQKKDRIVRTSLGIGIFSAASLWIYPNLLEITWYSHLNYSLSTYPPYTAIIGITLYLLIILIINKLFTKKLTRNHLRFKELFLLLLIIGWWYFFLREMSITPIIIYYLIVATSEEWIKYLSSLHIYKKSSFTKSDLILFSLLVALGFAFFENIIYMLQDIQSIHSFLQQIIWWTKILISRGLVGFLIHMLFTGVIAAISLYAIQKKQHMGILFIALLTGIILHMWYNILLHYDISISIIFYIIAGYFLLSRLFWKSDSIYLERKWYSAQ